MSDAYVSLSNLTLAYGDSIAVPDLSLDIKEGELIALLGPSGCGKTTTMRAIAGLMPVQSGSIKIDGKDVTRVPANKRGIGLVFQSYALFPHLSAFENAAFGLRLKRNSADEILTRTNNALATVGLSELADRKPAEMSGGQQQRLALARSLVMNPTVLLLDEPLSNLDAKLRVELRTELQRIQKETGVTMVFVTHDQTEALALADRIVLMRNGCIEQLGTPEEIYNKPVTTFAAQFMGFDNLFKIQDGFAVSEHGKLPLGYTTDASFLAWRPSGVSVGTGSFEGTVTGVAFAGEHREYLLDTILGNIKADAPVGTAQYAMGAKVIFELPLNTARKLDGS